MDPSLGKGNQGGLWELAAGDRAAMAALKYLKLRAIMSTGSAAAADSDSITLGSRDPDGHKGRLQERRPRWWRDILDRFGKQWLDRSVQDIAEQELFIGFAAGPPLFGGSDKKGKKRKRSRARSAASLRGWTPWLAASVIAAMAAGVVLFLWPRIRLHIVPIALAAGLWGLLPIVLGIAFSHSTRVKGKATVDPKTSAPLSELERFARDSGARLRTSYRLQIWLAVGVAFILGGLVVWSAFMFTFRQKENGTIFGTGGVGGMVLTKWKWQPFEKASEARRLADRADVLALAIGQRLLTISEIKDPVQRQKLQWEAANDFLASSK